MSDPNQPSVTLPLNPEGELTNLVGVTVATLAILDVVMALGRV